MESAAPDASVPARAPAYGTSTADAVTQPDDAPARRILVIDDEESLRHSVVKHLRRAGYVVEAAANGREGVDRFGSGGFDAVVTDVRLPDISGLDIAALCTEIDPDVPVLVMTGYGSVESALEAMRRGARDYLQKPFELADLLRVLEREIAVRAASRDRKLRAQVERRFASGGFEAVESELRRIPAPAEGGGAGGEGGDVPASAQAAHGDGTPGAAPPVGLREAQRRFEIRYVEDLLARTGGNVAKAARYAGISRPNFHKKLKTLGVDPARFKAAHRRGKSAGL